MAQRLKGMAFIKKKKKNRNKKLYKDFFHGTLKKKQLGQVNSEPDPAEFESGGPCSQMLDCGQ